jgi:hypothetical protein
LGFLDAATGLDVGDRPWGRSRSRTSPGAPDVDVAYVRRLIDVGALGPEGAGFRDQDVHVTALLHMWEDAGLTAESILAAIESGELSLDFLESPGWGFLRGSTRPTASSRRSGACPRSSC